MSCSKSYACVRGANRRANSKSTSQVKTRPINAMRCNLEFAAISKSRAVTPFPRSCSCRGSPFGTPSRSVLRRELPCQFVPAAATDILLSCGLAGPVARGTANQWCTGPSELGDLQACSVSFSAVWWSLHETWSGSGWAGRWNQFHRAWTTYGTRLNTIVRLAWDFLPLLGSVSARAARINRSTKRTNINVCTLRL
ncbi:hypothetical protein BDV19DRAFT_359714 [Aspergillus venezuelensis]